MALEELDNVWMTEVFFTIDADTERILDAMGDVEACLGLTPEQVVGLPLLHAVHRDDAHDAQRAIERTRSERRASWEGRVQHVDGTFRDYAWEGRLSTDGSTIYARSRDVARTRAALADVRVFERLADLTTDLFIVLDNGGQVVRANRAALETHNQSIESLMGRDLIDFVPEASHPILYEIPAQLSGSGHVVNFRVPAFDGRGGEIILEGAATFDDVTDRWYVVERDVTDRVAHEQELEVAERFFELSTGQLVLVDVDDRVLRANPAFVDAVGVPLDHLIGSDITGVLQATRAGAFHRTLQEVREGQTTDRREVGVVVQNMPRVLDVHMASGGESGIVYLSCRDITEERSLQQELMHRATRDGLTGLVNRATLIEAIETDLDAGRLAAFVLLDLDGFKQVNDSLGHVAGDELLTLIGQRLSKWTRAVDVVSRLGGDEFAVLLRGVPDASTALLVAEKLRLALHEPFDVQGRTVKITASVGTAIGRAESHSTEELLLEADLAAYAAKDSGANRSRGFDAALREATDFAHAVEEHLRRVLEAEVFELEVVPVKNLDGVTIGVGVSAPAIAISGQRRWNAESMQVAKRLGLLGPLSLRLASESVVGLSGWLGAHPDAYLDIVVDVIEIEVAGFAEQLLDLLGRHDVSPSQLIVSLTGVAAAGIHAVELAAIDHLRRAGVRVSFAGSRADTNTLAALHLQCVDRIEVDTARLALAPEGSVDRLIASTVFDVADRLGVEIVADASFAPDVVDTVSMFPNCAPVGLVVDSAVPIADFLRAEMADVTAPETTRDG